MSKTRLHGCLFAHVASLVVTVLLPWSLKASTLIVWNIGQGSWATLSDSTTCHHFDLGGEFAPWSAIKKECRAKANLVSFSHWDLDHVGFASKALMSLPNLCVAHRPLGEAPNVFREQSLAEIPDCGAKNKGVAEIFARASEMASSNAKSRVFLSRRILFPGDSGSREEKIWAGSTSLRSSLERPRVLVAGHHGSRTATSSFLLRKLTSLRLVIVSARKEKFGHPSNVAVKRIAQAHLPLLTTEDWGTIRMELDRPTQPVRNQLEPRTQRAARGFP